MRTVLIQRVSSCFAKNSCKYHSSNSFFVYGNDVPEGVGFGLFSIRHIIWLIITFGVVAILLLHYAGCSDRQRKVDRITGAFLVALIVIRILVLCVIGKMSLYELPLHLCSLAGIFCFIFSIRNYDLLGQVLYTLCLPGTLFALFFPDWSYYPSIHFITIQAFLFHGGIVFFVGCQLISHKIIPDVRRLWSVLFFLIGIVLPVLIFDIIFKVNYMFLRHPSAGSPLSWMFSCFGTAGYITGYAITVIAVCILMPLIYKMVLSLRTKKE